MRNPSASLRRRLRGLHRQRDERVAAGEAGVEASVTRNGQLAIDSGVKTIAWVASSVVVLGAVVIFYLHNHHGPNWAYHHPPTLSREEAKPIIERALQRIHQRLIQIKDRFPALSEIEKVKTENCQFEYKKGKARMDRRGDCHFDSPDSCSLSVSAYCGFIDGIQIGPAKTYHLDDDLFNYDAWIISPTGGREIHQIVEQEMDIAAKEILQAQRSKNPFWRFW